MAGLTALENPASSSVLQATLRPAPINQEQAKNTCRHAHVPSNALLEAGPLLVVPHQQCAGLVPEAKRGSERQLGQGCGAAGEGH